MKIERIIKEGTKISYGGKIFENMFIVLTLSRQMCYYHANERPNINTDKTATSVC